MDRGGGYRNLAGDDAGAMVVVVEVNISPTVLAEFIKLGQENAERFAERDFREKACGDSPEGSQKRCELFKGHIGLHQNTKKMEFSKPMVLRWR